MVTSNGNAPNTSEPKTLQAALTQRALPGLSMWMGMIREEEQPQLKTLSRRLKINREMTRDATVGAFLDAIKLPLLAASFDVIPGGDSALDQEAALFLHDTLGMVSRGDSSVPWHEHVSDALEALEFGFALVEMTLSQRIDGKVGVGDLTPIGQETLPDDGAWELDSKQDVVQVWQGDPNTPGADKVSVPGWKLLHFTFKNRKRNPEGESILNSVWRDWRYRVNFEELEGISVERDVGGVPVVYPPWEPTTAEKDSIVTQFKYLKIDEEGMVLMPGPKAGSGGTSDTGWTVEPYGSSSKALNTREIITYYDTRILRRLFAQFLMLGSGEVGSWALVKGNTDFFSLALKGIQTRWLHEWNNKLVPFVMGFNPAFRGAKSPLITWSDPGKREMSALADLYQRLRQSSVLSITEADEDFVRAEFGLPDRPEGVGEGVRKESPAFMPGFPGAPAAPPGGGALPGNGAGNGAGGGAGVPAVDQVPAASLPLSGWLQVPTVTTYADPIPRSTPGSSLDTRTNAYQQEILAIYDRWSVQAHRALRRASNDGLSVSQQIGIVDAMLGDLEFDLRNLARTQLVTGAQTALQGTPLSNWSTAPAVLTTMAQRLQEAERAVQTQLIPDLRAKLVDELRAGAAQTDARLTSALESRRGRTASHAGGYWVMSFDVQRIAGMEENRARRAQGLDPIPVLWELDPAAQHCADSTGFFGCPSLAGVYANGWESLPTVPAGQVTCRGQCKCRIKADFGNGFEVIT